MRLKKGDTVIVLSGKDKGKKGRILSVLPASKAGQPDNAKIIVERVNVAKRHQKPSRTFQGGIIEKPLAFFASKAILVCPRCSQPTRPVSRLVEDKRVRACRECEEIIDKV